MTRKDYELIAAALAASICETKGESSEYARGVRTQHHVSAAKLARALEATNERFDRERFLKACGIE